MADRRNTIDDETWHGLQRRAHKANPKLADVFSDEADRHRRQGRANYDKRRLN